MLIVNVDHVVSELSILYITISFLRNKCILYLVVE